MFSDGSKFTGPTIGKVVVGLDSLKLEVAQKNVRATGSVALPGNPPPAGTMTNPEDFKRYSALMLNQNLDDMRVATLRGCISFLGYTSSTRTSCPSAMPS